MKNFANMSPKQVRSLIKSGEINGPTAGMSAGYAQCNLIILPADLAADFDEFASKNPQACPVLERLSEGQRLTKHIADGADIATDFPRYRIYEHGKLTQQPTDISHLWRSDFVSFLIGCSFSFEHALLEAGLPVRHIELGANVPMYNTNIACTPAGALHGNMVVSMRPMTAEQACLACKITARMPKVHGAPIHIGDPEFIGISDITEPDYGDKPQMSSDELPVFWPCGVTPQAIVQAVAPAFAITHAPGHMLITDTLNQSLME